MRTMRIWTAALVVSAMPAVFAQQPPCCFEMLTIEVLTPAGKAVLSGRLGDAPYKPGTDAEPSVDFNFDGKNPVRDKQGQVVSGVRFYGWSEGSNI